MLKEPVTFILTQRNPENLNFYEAIVSGHFNDWAFKMNPVGAVAATITLATLAGVGIVYYLKHL